MYPNLNAEMARRGITVLALSERVNIPYSTLAPKLRGKKPVKLDEAYAIYGYLDAVKPFENGMTLETLFEKEGA